jgi:hypothetical protein
VGALSNKRIWARSDEIVQVMVDVRELPLEPADVLLDALLKLGQGKAEPVLLLGEHVDDLTSPPHQCIQSPRSFIGEGSDPLGEEGEDSSVDLIGLGQLSCGLREVPYLPWIHDDDGNLPGRKRDRSRDFEASGGFQDHEGGPLGLELLKQPDNPLLGIGEVGDLLRAC